MPTDPITTISASDSLETLRTTSNTNHQRRFWRNVVTKIADYTVEDGVDAVFVDVPAATTVTITLPDGAVEYSGREVLIVARTMGGSGQLDIDCADGSDTVGGASSVSMTVAGNQRLVISDGVDDWHVITT